MEYTVTLNEQHLELLKSIFAQIEPMALTVVPSKKPIKLSKSERMEQHMREYDAKRAARKRK